MSLGNNDNHYMSHAIKLARKGLYTTHPNPRVGCVVVKDGSIVGEAWHDRAGQPHAEVLALRQSGEAARGASVYVNLEPCCHQGRTPPCTGFLIDAGVTRVVAAMEDPNPQVAGGGIQNLRSAGIDVDVGVMRKEAERLNRGFLHRINTGRPWVTLKVAASMDGRTAMHSGESRWISGEAARKDVHHWRAQSSAVLTGSGTILADDPALTARHVVTPRQPLRVIVDSNFVTPADARVARQPGSTLVATANKEFEYQDKVDSSLEVVYLPAANGNVDLLGLMENLSQREINDVLVEAGPILSGSMLKAGLVDEVLLYLAPKFLGTEARGMFSLPELQSLDKCMQFDVSDVRQFGTDLRVRLRPR
jgi:diaminohydroxyphosphoribosylaminopyrimidine deaminase/5-amino-6-(5-phosphoribosylamino)uracil reductase